MGTPLPLPKRGAEPQIFGPYLLWPNGWMDQDGTWHGGRPQPRRLCVRWGPSPLPQKGAEHPSRIFGPFLLWPNGWMHQDATWYGGRPQPRGLCVRWGPSPLFPKRWSPPIFGPCLLWPNGWMDLDGTWHGGRPWSSPHCARWGHSSPPPKREQSLQFWAHLYCGQTAGCIKMPLGTEVGFGRGHIVLDGDPAPPSQKGDSPSPNFRPMSIVAKRLHGSRWHLVRR